MIQRNITFNGNLDYRDPISYYFAKWFDEPFTVDVINRTKYRNWNAILASDKDDRNHIDFIFEDENKMIHKADCKIHMHNFEYNDDKGIRRCADVVSVGNYALYNSKSEYYTIVYRNFICFIKRNDLLNIHPMLVKNNSVGQNGSVQNLLQYNVNELFNNSFVDKVAIPSDMFSCYDEAYKLYTRYRDVIRQLVYNKFNIDEYNRNKANIINEFRINLIPVIDKFNNIYNEIPKIDINDNLSDIMSLIS